MSKPPSLNPLRLVADSWRFLLRQPALWHVLIWFMIVPSIAMDVFEAYPPQSDVPSIDRIGDMGYGLAMVLFLFVTFWGVACVQVVGRRMIQSKAGRARTSFKSVRRDAVPLILPLFFTDVLRSLITLEWALLYIVPSGLFLIGWTECREAFPEILRTIFQSGMGEVSGNVLLSRFPAVPVHCFAFFYLLPLLIPAAVYMLRTMLFDVIIGAEGLTYREALRRSQEVIRKRFWKTVFSVLGVVLILGIPAGLLSWGASSLQQASFPDMPVVGQGAIDVVLRFALLIFALSMIGLFGKLRKLSTSPREVKPKDI